MYFLSCQIKYALIGKKKPCRYLLLIYISKIDVYMCVKICGEGKINVGFTSLAEMFLSGMYMNPFYMFPPADINYLFYYHGKSRIDCREMSGSNIGPHTA